MSKVRAARRSVRVGNEDFKAAVRLAVERTQEIRLALRKFVGDDFGDWPAEVRGDREVVYLREAFIEADETQIAIEKTEADGGAIVDRVELGQALGGEGLQSKGQAGVGEPRAQLGRGGWGRIESFRESFRKLLGWDGASVEPALADVATQPEEHVGDGLAFDAFSDRDQAKAVAEADDGGGDLSALPRVRHGANEAGVDLEFVEGELLQVAQAGVAGPEVVQGQA